MGRRVGLDRCGKSHPHRDSIPGPSSPQPVVLPTELPGPPLRIAVYNLFRVTCLAPANTKVVLQYGPYLDVTKIHDGQNSHSINGLREF